MRILILTCATGGGHLRAAAALEKYIRETTTHEVIQMDFLKSIGKLLDKTICDSYLFMAKKTPSLFGRLYKTTNKDNPLADFVPHTTELLALQLYPRLAEVAPDVIIASNTSAMNIFEVVPEKLLPRLWKAGIAALVMGVAAYLANELLAKVISSAAVCCLGAIVVAVIIYALLVVVLKAITYEDCLLLPKGGKIAKVLRLQ